MHGHVVFPFGFVFAVHLKNEKPRFLIGKRGGKILCDSASTRSPPADPNCPFVP